MKIAFCNLMPLLLFVSLASCLDVAQEDRKLESLEVKNLPLSDPNNEGGWILNEDLSDEFEGQSIDTSKWFVQGREEQYYIWKGRAPAQFAPHNVIVEDGKLKLRTQWEPSFDFVDEEYAGARYGEFEGKPLPVTTAGIITHKRFLNGYMEVKSKVGNAAITGAFWAIGYEQELDVFEQMGNPKQGDGSITANSVRTAVHDWSPPAVRPTKVFGYDEKNLPYRTADEFHVYGAEWGEDYLTIYRDGELTYHVSQEEVGTDWVLNNPMEVWLDSEIFRWLGVPGEDDLPVDFEVEYMRVWQKPETNLIDRAFFGFEGPILFEDNPKPLDLLPESSIPDDYQKFWLIDSMSAKYFSIVEGEYASGVNSLMFSGFGKNEELETDQVLARSPMGAVDLPAGDFTLSFKIWIDHGRAVRRLTIRLLDPSIVIPLDLGDLERRQWVTIEKSFSRPTSSSAEDQLEILILKTDVPEIKASKLYLDDVEISAN